MRTKQLNEENIWVMSLQISEQGEGLVVQERIIVFYEIVCALCIILCIRFLLKKRGGEKRKQIIHFLNQGERLVKKKKRKGLFRPREIEQVYLDVYKKIVKILGPDELLWVKLCGKKAYKKIKALEKKVFGQP